MDDLIAEFSRTIPYLAILMYVTIIVRRTQTDCFRACELVRIEIARLAREREGDPEPDVEPDAALDLDEEEPQAPLPEARVVRR